MSARVQQIDRETRIVWIDYVGRGDELSVNFASYGVDFISSLFNGRVGISYKRGMSEESIGVFAASAATMVNILTIRSGITERDEADFATALIVVQSCQNVEESVQGRELAAFVRGVRRKVGGAA